MVAATLDLLHTQLLCSTVPGHAVLFCKRLCHILQNSICEPAVVIFRFIHRNRHNSITLRAEVAFFRSKQCTDNTLIVTGFIGAICHTVFKRNTALKNQLLANGFLILVVSQPSIFIHSPENVFFSLFVVIWILVRIVVSGRVGNTNDTCTLCRSQAFNFLSKIGFRSTSDTTAALTQINEVQIQFQNFVFIIAFLHLNRSENLKDFTLNRYIVSSLVFRKQNIFDQLLCDTGTTCRGITKEHSCTGLNGCHPVNTLMLIETVVFNRYGRVDHVLRNIRQICPGTVGHGINILILLDASVGIDIVQIGVLLQIIIINLNICHRQNVILQIITKNTGKNKRANNANHQYCTGSTHSNFKCAKRYTPCRIDDLQQEIGPPILAFRLFLLFLISLKHRIYLHPGSKNHCLGEKFTVSLHQSIQSCIDYSTYKQKTKDLICELTVKICFSVITCIFKFLCCFFIIRSFLHFTHESPNLSPPFPL